MKALELDWGTMHVEVSHGEGPALVFLNSLGTDLRMWDDVCARIPSNWSTLRMDKRGHGLSETGPEGHGIGDLASDVLHAMDFAAIERAVIIGCSVGGLIAQHIALMKPERVQGLVLSNTAPALGSPERWLSRINTISEAGMASVSNEIIQLWFGPAFLETAEVTLWNALLKRTDQSGYIACCRAIADADITGKVSEISCPSLVLAGQHDRATPPAVVQALAHALPRAEYQEFRTAGHLPAVEVPCLFAAALEGFVERIPN